MRLIDSADEKLHSGAVDFIRAGGCFALLKDRVGHGNWGKYVDKHLPIGRKQVSNYIRAYHGRAQLADVQSLSTAVAQLTPG